MVDQSVTSINQSGGITAGTVNFSKPVRLVTPAFEVELREKIPNKSKQIVIGCDWGNAEANRYATQIWQVLKSLGYNAGDGITQYSTPANAPLVISWGENSADAPVQITVGNND